MDTSDEYIKMCLNAEEIQSIWEPNIGDYYAWNGAVSIIGADTFKTHTHTEARDKKIWGCGDYDRFIVGEYKEWVLMHFDISEVHTLKENISEAIMDFQNIYKHYIHCSWHPRQDQLIEMNIRVSREKYNYANFDDFGIIKDMMEYTEYTYETFEQFLLNELMVTKYGKHWNGKDWVVE